MTVALPPAPPQLPYPLSPSSLKVLHKCARLFRYVYLDHLLWPQDLHPVDLLAGQRGEQFHRLVELHQRGIDVEPLLKLAEAPIPEWWRVYSASSHARMTGEVWSEVPLWMERRGIRFAGRLDRLVIDRERQRFTIVDWKTETHRPDSEQLHRSWQVRLYPLMMCLAGSQFNQGQPIRPEQVHLTIWYVQHPQQPFELVYSQVQFEHDVQQIDAVIERLYQGSAQGYPRTQDMGQCRSCWFATRCYGLMPQGLDPDIAAALEGLVRFQDDPEG
ncbi:MAG: PD-(D/E)XK nuclease family protein [Synechococcales cyanobacterium]